MSPARVTEVRNKDGSVSFKVVYRRGGRGFRQEHGGTFRGWPAGKTNTGKPARSVGAARREALTRRDLVGGWLAQGKDPAVELVALTAPSRQRRLLDVYDAWVTSRHDVTQGAQRNYQQARRQLVAFFDDRKLVDTVTTADCREYMGYLAARYKPATVRAFWYPFAQALDFAELEPNPARHRTVKKPTIPRAEPVVMSLIHFKAILAALPEKWRLFFRILEATGMRVGELSQLTWGDIDLADSRFRVSVARTKGGTSGQRWVQVPALLMDELAGLLPLEDRVADRRLFRGLSTAAARSAMSAACKIAGVPHYHPHDLRHRRLSLWSAQGVPMIVVAQRAGHAKPSMTMNVYTHVVVDARDDEWLTGPEEEGGGRDD